jgi:hypothetical protein
MNFAKTRTCDFVLVALTARESTTANATLIYISGLRSLATARRIPRPEWRPA